MERLRAYYVDGGGEVSAPADVFEAVFANRPESPLDFHERILAVKAFQQLEAAESLASANKRVSNILRQAGTEPDAEPVEAVFGMPEEKALYARLRDLEPEVTGLLEGGRYEEALVRLADLREPVDAFFDTVMVMDEDPDKRRNRLALLARMRKLFMHTADLSRLAG